MGRISPIGYHRFLMKKKVKKVIGKVKDITLRDVVVHMEYMEQRLSSKIDDVDKSLSSKIDGVEKNLSSRIDENTRATEQNSRDIRDLRLDVNALGEDLVATIKDTVKIRQHVGMTSGEEI